MIQAVATSLPFIIPMVLPVIYEIDDERDVVFSPRADHNVKSLKSIYASVDGS